MIRKLEATEPTTAAHDQVFRRLRSRIMIGDIMPGQALTLRGIGAEYGVSMTPAREAVRRLVAEGALSHERVRALAPYTDFFGLGPEIWDTADPVATLGQFIDNTR